MTTWADTYTPRVRQVTLLYQGGPADGTRHRVPVSRIPEYRYWAPADARDGRAVELARYVRHDQPKLWAVNYRYTGLEYQPGPVPPADASQPDWS